MNKSIYRQSALLISGIVTGLFVLARWNPLFHTIGIARTSYDFAVVLAIVWIVFALLTATTNRDLSFASDRNSKWSIIVFVIAFCGWIALRFLGGYQASTHGFGIEFSVPVTCGCYIIEAIAAWALISISAREEMSHVLNHKWIKWVFGFFCVLGVVYICYPRGFVNGQVVKNVDFGLFNILICIPIVWYAVYCTIRFFMKHCM